MRAHAPSVVFFSPFPFCFLFSFFVCVLPAFTRIHRNPSDRPVRPPIPTNQPVAQAKIQANTEMFYKSGSDINLTCTSEMVSHAPSFIYWYKDGYLINYSQRGGINVLTDQQTARSTLLISRAAPPDSGNYTCFPSNTSKTAQSLPHTHARIYYMYT